VYPNAPNPRTIFFKRWFFFVCIPNILCKNNSLIISELNIKIKKYLQITENRKEIILTIYNFDCSTKKRDMKRLFLFSDNLYSFYLNINFSFIKVIRVIKLFFHSRRTLEKISIDYYKNWHFDNAYLIVDLKFENAVWYRIQKMRSTDFTKPIILNLQNVKTGTIKLEVFGFFQKQTFLIELNRENQRLNIPQIEPLSQIKTISIHQFEPKLENIGFKIPQISTNLNIIQIET